MEFWEIRNDKSEEEKDGTKDTRLFNIVTDHFFAGVWNLNCTNTGVKEDCFYRFTVHKKIRHNACLFTFIVWADIELHLNSR